ncbi:MAG: hypothetical protein LWX54_07275 [Deltaproteobacteria bacterium]|jgi:hypothetical protein|nr:hypothetical protein [Deltaproteobacteria bacterium]
METARAYEEVVNFIATQTARNSLISFHPSEQAKERVMELIQKEKESGMVQNDIYQCRNSQIGCGTTS